MLNLVGIVRSGRERSAHETGDGRVAGVGPLPTDGPDGRPLYLALEPDPVLAFLHLSESGRSSLTAILLCPPFGWQDICSYRARRAWAKALAQAGHPTVRIDLPGTGDSAGSPKDPDRLAAWTGAVDDAAVWLRDTTGAERIAAIGIGLGGMVACRAVAQSASIDDLILWGVPARGRTLVRELRAYSAVAASQLHAEVQDPPPEGALEVTGFLLSQETRRALDALDLTTLPLPNESGRRVLLLERDGLGVDQRLRIHFEHYGVAVTVADGNGYATFMARPDEAQTPVSTVAQTISWLAEATDAPSKSGGRLTSMAPPAAARESMEFCHAGTRIRESPLDVRGPGGVFGLLSEPAEGEFAPVCAILLNPGANRRIGPNRTWVEIARNWAARGVPTVRVDLPGTGDSEVDEIGTMEDANPHAASRNQHVLAILNALEARGLPNRFIVVGLCSGAYHALHAALADARVAGALLINLYSFYWNRALVAERERRRAVAALRGDAWTRLMHRQMTREQFRGAVLRFRPTALRKGWRSPAEAAQTAHVDRALDKLRDRGTQVLLLFCAREPLYHQFAREGRIDDLHRWPNVRLERVPSSDHDLRALWLQRLVEESLDRGLDRVLEVKPWTLETSGGRLPSNLDT